MEEAKNGRFIEINPSGFPKMRGENKVEKGGTGVENGWGREMAHTHSGPIKKIEIFFRNFLFGDFHSPQIFSS